MDFRNAVFYVVKRIPKGKVATYKIIAEKVALITKNKRHKNAYRAVGNILNRNKKPIVIPCHRVVNSNGNIGGYSLGVNKKIKLLKKEGIKIVGNKIKNFKDVLWK